MIKIKMWIKGMDIEEAVDKGHGHNNKKPDKYPGRHRTTAKEPNKTGK